MTFMPDPTSSTFQRHQIICLEDDDGRLYGEVIDVISQRQLLWARPLVLVQGLIAADWEHAWESHELHKHLTDLREAAHLLLPLHLFRPALDMEVLPLLGYLAQTEELSTTKPPEAPAASQMRQFIDQVWQHQMGEPKL